MADLSQYDKLSAELKAGLEHIETRIRLVREMCGTEPDFEKIIKQLKAVRRSLDVVSKILQHTYISRHVLRHAQAGGSAKCLSDLCRRVMAERAEALREEQKKFFREHIPALGSSIDSDSGQGRNH